MSATEVTEWRLLLESGVGEVPMAAPEDLEGDALFAALSAVFPGVDR